jgi:hypothetical protein
MHVFIFHTGFYHICPTCFGVPCTPSSRRTFYYLLTCSMEQSPSWESNRFSASQEIPPAFYGPRRFITAFTIARRPSLSWTSLIQPISPHPTSWRSISLLSSNLRLGLSFRFLHQNSVHASPLRPYALRALPISEPFAVYFVLCMLQWL